MIKYNIIRNIAFIGLLLFSVASCDQEDYLETVDKSRLTDATMWASEGNADIYLNDCYSELPSKSNQPDNLDNFKEPQRTWIADAVRQLNETKGGEK